MFPNIPGYRIDSELGRGGMGVVYRAQCEATGQWTALKLMLHGRGARLDELARFRVEAEALACLAHRNIAKVLAVGVFEGAPYFATEYAANGTIRDYANREDKSIEWCVDAIRQVALGVHHAHTRALIHRDIKPANILVMDDETPKITDFGLVKFRVRVRELAAASRAPLMGDGFGAFDLLLDQFGRELAAQYPGVDSPPYRLVDSLRRACLERTGLPPNTIDNATIDLFLETVRRDQQHAAAVDLPALDDLSQPGAILGSPQFMSPEQVQGDCSAIGPRTDVYGLGATLYWLLTGVPVNSGRDVFEVFRKIRTEWPQPVQELNARVSEAVDCVVWKAIQKDPPRRYENCKLLAEELQCCLEGKQPAAQKSRERHRRDMPPKSDARYADAFLKAFPPKRG